MLIRELVCFEENETEQKQGFFHNTTSMTSLGRLFHCLMGPQCLTIFPNDFTGLVSPLYIACSSFEHILCIVLFWKCLWYIHKYSPLSHLTGWSENRRLPVQIYAFLHVHAKLNFNAQTAIYALYTFFSQHRCTLTYHMQECLFSD